ncbi:class I SAM-dependent methyltransferase [Candidatus Rhodobacter oscarellae]|nr:class I SAM-dependent methyltransferase [Candidatus Rhodobacter lobularis]
MQAEAKFWDRLARKYAASPIKNMTAYEATLARVQARLGADDNVLEMGCGTGTTALRLAGGVAHYTGTDLSSGMIDVAREKLAESWLPNVTFTVAPAVETRFERASYDAVLSFNLLHLLEDVPAALSRAHDLLKPGGLLITKTPCLAQMGLHVRMMVPVMRFFGKAPYVGFFNAAELSLMIERAGFALEESRSFEGAPNALYVVARRL